MTNTIKVYPSKVNISTVCIVCGESVQLTDNECFAVRELGCDPRVKMCDKCKKAIMHMRKQMRKEL